MTRRSPAYEKLLASLPPAWREQIERDRERVAEDRLRRFPKGPPLLATQVAYNRMLDEVRLAVEALAAVRARHGERGGEFHRAARDLDDRRREAFRRGLACETALGRKMNDGEWRTGFPDPYGSAPTETTA